MTFTFISNSFKDGDYLPSDFILSAERLVPRLTGGAENAVPHINDESRMLGRKQSHRAMQIRAKVHGQSASVVSQGAIR